MSTNQITPKESYNEEPKKEKYTDFTDLINTFYDE